MKNLFRDHSYNMVKMFLNQFAIAIFGFSLALASGKAENSTLRNVTSVCAILFYLFLLYTMTWEIGFRERVSVLHGKMKNQPYKGALISLFANIPNLIFAVLVTLGTLVPHGVCATLGAFGKTAALLLEGMYTGLMAHPIDGKALNQFWFVYFIIVIPAILVCGFAYFLGLRDVKFTSLFNQEYPESDRAPKQKRWGRDDD